MSMMFAVIYDDLATAESALASAQALEEAGYATILDQALITKDENGKADVGEKKHPTGKGALVGGVLGGVLGMVLLLPVAGAAAGAAIGGAIGHSQKSGAGDFASFVQTVASNTPNGGAAVVLFGSTTAPERVMHDLGSFGGTVYSYDVGDEELADLQKQIDRASSQ